MNLFDLSGKTAIVTGGGKGIGRQMAQGLAEAGANLVLCARQAERCEQAAGRVMIDGDGGSIVNIASVAGLQGGPPEIMNAIPYNTTKGGVIAFTRDLATKWARHGIRVNAIAPGWFPSDMANFVLDQHGDELLKHVPLGRFGGPEDLKGVVVFLASDASAFVTAHTLVVDGGQSAW